ncbi:AEC family transporter [uncultured Piscinibacter sp.]|uniref:AEC family transporter n=1 Tax=uncultured Piscinibacter sp. TaxID=1131835 RepID=UPI002624BDDB|nr:AEC family transporter [uncultured Piscinibacter sp.]
MNNVILLLACFALGIALRASGRLPANAPSALNGFVINVSLPALTLVTVRGLTLELQLALAALTPWLLLGVGAGFFWAVGRLLSLPKPTIGALILTGALANTSFIGIPMIETWYGAEHVGIGIVVDQLGSYMALSTLGIVLAGLCASRDARFDPKAFARKLLGFAPFISLLVALAMTALSFSYPDWLDTLLRRLATTLVPLALVSVGMQLRLSQIRGRMRLLVLGLGFKLVIGPALVLAVLAGLLGQRGLVIQVSVFEAAMGPMIGAAIVAMDHDLDPSLVTLMVGLGVPLSFLTLPAWWWMLQGFG